MPTTSVETDTLVQWAVADLAAKARTRSWIISVMQIVGAISILVSARFYGTPLLDRSSVWIVFWIALGFGIGFLFLSLGQWFTSPVARALLLSPSNLDRNIVERSEVISTFCYRMMILDALLSVGLVTLTGGLFRSVYSPLPLAICSTAFTLRLPRRALLKTVGLTILFIALGESIYQHWAHLRLDKLLSIEKNWLLPGEGNYESAVSVNLLAATGIAILGGLFPDELPTVAITRSVERLKGFLGYEARYQDAIANALRRFSYDLNSDPAAVSVSAVHESDALFTQAVILNFPYEGPDQHEMREAIAYLTFAAHRVDDLADHILSDVNRYPVATCRPADFEGSSRNLNNLIDRMLLRFGQPQTLRQRIFSAFCYRFILPESGQNERNVTYSRERKMCFFRCYSQPITGRVGLIYRALFRVELAAMIQRCQRDEEVLELLNRYVAVLGEVELHPTIVAWYQESLRDPNRWVTVWATAKCVLEMFDCVSNEFDLDASEVYTVLFSPFLVFQNADVESAFERAGAPFRRLVFDYSQKAEASKAFLQCAALFKQSADLLARETDHVRAGRRKQLRSLLDVFGHKLSDNLREAYVQIATDASLWAAPGGKTKLTLETQSPNEPLAPKESVS
jgi:hypothetical protein